MTKIIDFCAYTYHLGKKYLSMQASSVNEPFERWLILLRMSIGVIYSWFGILKFFPGVSPAEELAKETIHLLTFGYINSDLSLLLLAIWETIIGILMVSGLYSKLVIRMILLHMIFTFTPLFLLPGISFTSAPLALTLIGQYIIKNIVIICALFVIDTSSKQNG